MMKKGIHPEWYPEAKVRREKLMETTAARPSRPRPLLSGPSKLNETNTPNP
jgi:hypothetical protein